MKASKAAIPSWAIIGVLAVSYLAVILTVRNSYYQLMLTLAPLWAVFGLSSAISAATSRE